MDGRTKRGLDSAWAGNRTRASRVAGENSTTEPPMRRRGLLPNAPTDAAAQPSRPVPGPPPGQGSSALLQPHLGFRRCVACERACPRPGQKEEKASTRRPGRASAGSETLNEPRLLLPALFPRPAAASAPSLQLAPICALLRSSARSCPLVPARVLSCPLVRAPAPEGTACVTVRVVGGRGV